MPPQKPSQINIFSYVVDHDDGLEPNPEGGVCTLCRCKYGKKLEATEGKVGPKNIVELANEGDWLIGTGGVSKKSTGRGTLVYVMKVTQKLTREEFYRAFNKRTERPKTSFQKKEQFALISNNFYYFGVGAIDIPSEFQHFEKKGQGFRYVRPEDFKEFLIYVKKEARRVGRVRKVGKLGEPVARQEIDRTKGTATCKSSC